MSLAAIRMKIAKAKNDKEKAYNSMLNGRERAENAVDKFRELEATYEIHRGELKDYRIC